MSAKPLAGIGRFAAEWLRNPRQVGAIAPSAPGLADAITDGFGPESGPVIELGPGTGIFTERMIDRGVPASNIAAVEAGHGFASDLAQRFPGLHIKQGDAARLQRLVPFDAGSVASIICGIPLLCLPIWQVYRIMRESFTVLGEGCEFRLFTYGLKCPVQRSVKERLALQSTRQQFVALNVPPATIYAVRKRSD